MTAEAIQESLDDAVKRGRVTRDDAQDLTHELLTRGRKQAEDFLSGVEALLGKGGAQASSAATTARRRATQRGDRVLREVDRARRAAGIGDFPILGYEDLDARQVTSRLSDLGKPELRKVRDFEKKHRNRKTVLSAIESRLS